MKKIRYLDVITVLLLLGATYRLYSYKIRKDAKPIAATTEPSDYLIPKKTRPPRVVIETPEPPEPTDPPLLHIKNRLIRSGFGPQSKPPTTTPSPYAPSHKKGSAKQRYEVDDSIVQNGQVISIAGNIVRNQMYTEEYGDVDTQRLRAAVEKFESVLKLSPPDSRYRHDVVGGRYGRGRSILTPFSNKWKYYVRHLRTVDETVPHVCEVGFGLGYSALLFLAMTKKPMTISITEFERYRNSDAQTAAIEYIRSVSKNPETFRVVAGASCHVIEHEIVNGGMKECGLISMDGSVTYGELLCDLYHFHHVHHNDTRIIVDDIDDDVLMTHNHSLTAVFLSSREDLLRYLVQEEVLKLMDCYNDISPGGYGTCAFKYVDSNRYRIVISGLMEYYLKPETAK